MIKTIFYALLPFGLLAACTAKNNAPVKKKYAWPAGITPPVCEKHPKELVLHGDKRVDDYYWLNGYFYKTADSTKVVDYLKAENAYTDTMMAGTSDLQKKLYEEMRGRIKEKDESVPYRDNGYYYYSRFVEGKDYFVYCRRKTDPGAQEEVLLDANAMAEGHSYFAARNFAVSPDNKLMIFGVDTTGRRQYVLRIKNLETGEYLPDLIERTAGYAVWGSDNRTVFYISNNPVTLLGEKVKKHHIGETGADATVYEEKDNTQYISVFRSSSRSYIFIQSEGTLSSEVRFIDAGRPDAPPVLFQPRIKDVIYRVSHQNDRFYILTNKEARNFRLMECAPDKTGVDNWKEVIAHREDALLTGVRPFKNYLVLEERKDGLQQLRIRPNNGDEHYIQFTEAAYSASMGTNAEYDTDTLRFSYTSLVTPWSTFDYDMKTRVKTLKKEQEVVGGYDKEQYVTERLWAPAKDGVKVPVSLVYKKGLEKNGNAPCLLYGYGSYGVTIDPTFSSGRISLLDRGFIFAIVHVRGGEDMGRAWYEDGKMMKKINTFTDFTSAADYLVQQKYTSPQHLYAKGGSAGGLLMGAIVNMRPELWHGVVANVPFVDVVTTMNDPNIPLTTNEYDEWGNPANKTHYDYMKSYSPYDNLGAKNYPNLLVTTGLNDSQVQYFEPAKWVAKMRTLKTSNNLLMLKTNMAAGHGGASGRFRELEEAALEYAFFLSLEDIGG